MILITGDQVIVKPGMSTSQILFELERARLSVMNGIVLPEVVAVNLNFQDQRGAEDDEKATD